MKKLTKTIMSALCAFAFVVASALGIVSLSIEAKAEALAETTITKIHHRSGDNRLLLFLENTDYSSVGATTHAPDDIDATGVNLLDKILIYTDDDTHVTLRDVWNDNKQTYYNVWGEMNSICLDTTLARGAIKYLVVQDGCAFPSATTHVAGYAQSGEVIFYNNGFGTSNDCIDWVVVESIPVDPVELTATSVTKVQVRDNKLFIFLSEQNYDQVAGNTSANAHVVADALLNNIEVYAGDTHATLKDAMATSGDAWYNHYGESGCIAIQLDGVVYTNASVSKIVIKAGCEFPSAVSGESAYVTENDVTFVSGGLDENGQSANWTVMADPDQEPETAEVYLRATGVHIRGGYRPTDGTIDNKFMIFFDSKTDILDAPATSPIDKEKVSVYNFLDRIMLWTTVDEEPITLRQAYESETATGELYYNIWGEQNCVAVQIGRYSADEIVRICIPKGTEFPSYEYTSGKLTVVKKYVMGETVYLKDWAPTQENHPIFSTNWAADRNFGDISATGVTFSDGTLEISLTGTDYPVDGENRIDNYFEGNLDCYDHITFDGVSLADYIDANGINLIDSWINATAYGTFAIHIEGLQAPSKIVIRKGCQLPIYANTISGVEIHNVFYFEVSESVIFRRQADGSYAKVDTLTWMVTFDGKNPIEVENGKTVDQLPVVEKAGYKFVGWKLNGAEFTTSTVITGDVNVQSQWVKVYTVTFDTQGGSTVENQIVEEECYIVKPQDPVREGYTFLGWVDGNGNDFDFNKAVTSDVTVVAKWKSAKVGGCGSVLSGVGYVAVALLGCAMLLKKKKEN